MSLFLVNRYLGDGDDDNSSNKESRSKALLAMLQKKAKEKEKLSLTSPNERRPDVRTDGQRTTTTKKKKKERKEKKERKASENGEHTPIPLKRKREEVTQTSSGAGGTKKAKKSSQKTKKNVESVPSPTDSPETGKDEQLENTDEGEEEEEEGEEKTEEEGEQQVKEGEDLLSDQSKQATEESLTQSGFTILGGFEEKQIRKVHRVLPQWLAQPDFIHRDIKSNLVSIAEVKGICPALVKKLDANGIQHFFPVQAEVIPAILESVAHGLLVGRGGYRPRDVCVSAPTGSGKTLAFVIPIVQALMHRVACEVRALVVLPTKELAQQVCKVFSLYSEGTGLKVVMIAGQKSFAAEQASLSEERCGSRRSLADIAVATPGRLVDHINKNSGFSLEHLRFLIIDEADRLIDSMHHSWLGQVSRAVFRTGSDATTSIFSRTEPADITAASLSPPQMPLQKLLFSATLTMNPEKLQQLRLHQPRLFSSVHSKQPNATGSQERFNFPEALTEYYVPCTMSSKPLAILHHVLRMKFSPVLCFTNSRETAHRLYLLVKLFGGVEVAEFSSRLSPGERKQTLRDFEQGNIQLLISTDAAARGIDVRGIKCVVNYDAPQYIRTYMHRIGRTARAGKAGLAFTFLLKVQRSDFLQMVADAGSPGIRKHVVKRRSLESMAARYKQALQELAGVIKEEKEKHRIRS